MNTDIRLAVGFWQHPKTKKLVRRCGLDGIRSLQVLWLWAAQNRPDGALTGMDVEDIELAADWNGDEGQLLAELVSIGWIDQDEAGCSLHDWQEHNSWAATVEERGDQGRFFRLAQVAPEVFARLKEQGITSISKEDYTQILKGQRGKPAPTSDSEEKIVNKNEGILGYPGGYPEGYPGQVPAPAPAPAPLKEKEKELCDAPPESVARSAPVAAPDGAEPSRTANSKISKQRKEILFEDFWNVFADKRGREPARKAWLKIPGFDEELARQIIAGAECYAEYRRQRQERDPTFIAKMAQGWLTDRRWEDDIAGPAQEQEFSMPPLTAEQIASIKRNTERARRLLLEREANA